MARRIEYCNDETYVTIHDKNDTIKKEKDDIYVTPIVSVSPNEFTPKLVGEALLRIKKSTTNTKTADRMEKEMPKRTRMKRIISDTYDEDGYTLARPFDEPTSLGTLVTIRTSSWSSQASKKDSVTKENTPLPAYSKCKSVKNHFQSNKRCLIGACLMACILVAFIVGFTLGLRSSKNNEGKCFERNIEYLGNDIRNTWRNSVSDCQLLCQRTEECMFFTFKHTPEDCSLKTSDSGRANYSDAVSGKKYCSMK